jgi:hypothetical protein
MGKQGCVLHERDVQRIVSLLSSTDMTIPEIAKRLGCSRSTVVSINRRFAVRSYGGRRGTWQLVTAEMRNKDSV